jgi:DNA-binding CsgD family transcriptional regulator
MVAKPSSDMTERLPVVEHVSRLYPYFFSNLSTAHTDLTPNEITLCGLLVLQLRNEAIAKDLGVEVHTVEAAKHRLKKKFKLPKEESIGGHLLKFTVPMK